MNKLNSTLISTILLFFIQNPCAIAHIDKAGLDLKVKELIKGNSHKWVIIDGTGIGIILNSGKESEYTIDPHFNKLTNAHGQIILNDKQCKGNLPYFSGTLLEIDAPKTSCGLGHVVKFEHALPLLQKTSQILSLQEKIRTELNTQKTDIDFIKKEIFKSVKELSALVKDIKAGKYKDINYKEGIILEANKAISANLSSIEKLNKFQRNESNNIFIKESFKKISEAYDSEVNIIEKVIKAEKYLN